MWVYDKINYKSSFSVRTNFTTNAVLKHQIYAEEEFYLEYLIHGNLDYLFLDFFFIVFLDSLCFIYDGFWSRNLINYAHRSQILRPWEKKKSHPRPASCRPVSSETLSGEKVEE